MTQSNPRITTQQRDVIAAHIRARGHIDRASTEWKQLSIADRNWWRTDIDTALRAAGLTIIRGPGAPS